MFQDMAGFEVVVSLVDKLSDTVSDLWPVIAVPPDRLDWEVSVNESAHQAVEEVNFLHMGVGYRVLPT